VSFFVGVLVVPAGPKVVRFVPPLIISEVEVQQAMQQVKLAIQQLVDSTHV